MKKTINDCKIIALPSFRDNRGILTPLEFDEEFKRCFWITRAQDAERGNHAHRQCCHFMIALSGNVIVSVDDGTNKKDFMLNTPTEGLYVPPMIWDIEKFYNNAALLVFASELYDNDDYIRDYQEYVSLNV